MSLSNKLIPNTPYMPIEQFDPKRILSIMQNEADLDKDMNSSDLNALLGELPSNMTDAGRDGFSYDVAIILHGMGMEKYIDLFKTHDVNLETFLQLNYNDLNQLGITNPADQDKIINDLKDIKSNTLDYAGDVPGKHFVVCPNSYEDFVVAKNILNQIIFLQSYGSYTILQMKKNMLFDYFVSKDKTAVGVLKLLSEQVLLQANRISDLLFNGNLNGNSLIATAIKESNKEVPPNLLDKLTVVRPKSKPKTNVKKIILTFVSLIGLPSLVILIGKRVGY